MTARTPDPVLLALCTRLGDEWRASPVTAAPELTHTTQPGSDSHALFERFEARGLVEYKRRPRKWGDVAIWKVTRLGLSLATQHQVHANA